MTIWVIEQGDYEDRGVEGVASNPEIALAWLRVENARNAANHPSNRLCSHWEMRDTPYGSDGQCPQVTITGYHDGGKYIYQLEPHELAE